MAEKEEVVTTASSKEEAIDKIKQGMKKQGKKETMDYQSQIATRDKIERDFKEDILRVSFSTSPETKRTVKATRPTQRQMITIMKLTAEAMMYENRTDQKSLDKMLSVYSELPKVAAELCVDKSMNEEFWVDRVSFSSLQDFITNVMIKAQSGSLEEGELESFREE